MNDLYRNLKSLLDEIAEISSCLWDKGWAERNGGNISVDITDECSSTELPIHNTIPLPAELPELDKRSFLVKIGGARFFNVARKPDENLLIITIDNRLNNYNLTYMGRLKKGRPTSELLSHLKIHQYLRRNAAPQKVFLHTHPTHIIALSHIPEYNTDGTLNNLLFSIHPEVMINLPEGAGFVPYQCPGGEELAESTVMALKNHRVIIWEKHGCAAVGNTVTEAFDLIDIVDKAARIFFICKAAGYKPSGLTNNQLNELNNKVNGKQL